MPVKFARGLDQVEEKALVDVSHERRQSVLQLALESADEEDFDLVFDVCVSQKGLLTFLDFDVLEERSNAVLHVGVGGV
jgi:hypothetical protein